MKKQIKTVSAKEAAIERAAQEQTAKAWDEAIPYYIEQFNAMGGPVDIALSDTYKDAEAALRRAGGEMYGNSILSFLGFLCGVDAGLKLAGVTDSTAQERLQLRLLEPITWAGKMGWQS